MDFIKNQQNVREKLNIILREKSLIKNIEIY
jgi:hypothetical protein